MNNRDIILAPIITEKSMQHAGLGKFSFKVATQADKRTIRRAIEEKFSVNVLNVWTMIVKGRKTRVGTRRNEVAVPPWKKAIVILKKGQNIGLFDLGKKQK